MPQLLQQPSRCDQSSHLSGQEKTDPYQVLEDFFCDTNLSETEDLFDKILETCLTTDDGPFCEERRKTGQALMFEEKDRASFGGLFFYNQVQRYNQ